jgi:hypothetical protein
MIMRRTFQGKLTRQRSKLRIIVLIVFLQSLLGLSIPVQAACTTPLTVRDFETGDFSGWSTEFPKSYSGQIVTSPVRNGNYASRFEVRDGDYMYGGARSEFREVYTVPNGDDIWYGWSTYIPADWLDPDMGSVITQMHGSPDPGESRSPPFAVRVEDGKLTITGRYSSVRNQPGNDGTPLTFYGPSYIEKEIWHDFVVHVKWSYENDGYLDVWMDGNQIVDYNGPIGYNDYTGPYFKMGIYHIDTIGVLYHDEYRRGCSYEEVDPSGGQPSFCGDGTCDPGESCSTCESDCGTCPVGEYHWLEAEYADTINSPMQVAADSAASQEEFIYVPNGAGTGGEASYTVTISEASDYILWGRTIAPDGDNDSFFIEVDSSGDNTWNVEDGTTWQWDLVNDWDTVTYQYIADPVMFPLSAGTHTIKVKQREDGTKLDKILFTNDLSYIPTGEGEPAENQHFLPEQYIEAEDGDLTAPMQTGTDSAASGGSYIYTSTNDQGSANFTFEIEYAGRYIMEVRVLTPPNMDGHNSFYIGLNGEPVQGDSDYIYDTIETETFAWDNVSLRGPYGNFTWSEYDPMIWELSKGLHTFTFYGREPDTRLDQIILKRVSQYHRADNNPQDGCIDIDELLAFIVRWKISIKDVPMAELMGTIGLWKGGC